MFRTIFPIDGWLRLAWNSQVCYAFSSRYSHKFAACYYYRAKCYKKQECFKSCNMKSCSQMQFQYGHICGEVHSEIILLPVYRTRAGVCLNQYCVLCLDQVSSGNKGFLYHCWQTSKVLYGGNSTTASFMIWYYFPRRLHPILSTIMITLYYDECQGEECNIWRFISVAAGNGTCLYNGKISYQLTTTSDALCY